MNISIANSSAEVEALRELVLEWKESGNCDRFGLEVDVNILLSGLMDLVDGGGSDLLILKDDGKPIGFMGLTIFTSPFGEEKVVNERYLYIAPGSNAGKSILRLIEKAQVWGKSKGCSHLMLNASMAASDTHEKVCNLYERIGMKQFETSYIREIV